MMIKKMITKKTMMIRGKDLWEECPVSSSRKCQLNLTPAKLPLKINAKIVVEMMETSIKLWV